VPFLVTAIFSALCLLTIASCLAAPSYAQTPDLVVAPVEPANRVSLVGHHPAWAAVQNDVGAVPADSLLGPFGLVLARSPQQQQAFDQFLREQLDPSSPNYHHWLTSVEIGERFGASQHDLDAITSWLQSQNLHLDSIANSRVRIRFSGPASAIGNAFGAEMRYYLVDGEQRFAIADEPKIPVALAGIIKSVTGLYSIDIRPLHGSGSAQVTLDNNERESQGIGSPDMTSSNGKHFVTPSDFATIYDLKTLSVNGAGQTIAIIGRSRVFAQDITNFQKLTGLAQQPPTEIVPPLGTDPGPAETSPPLSGKPSEDQLEATLDVGRAGSIAPGATIDLVISASSGGGIGTATEYVVDTPPVPAPHIMNISFGACESSAGSSGVAFWDSLFSQASVEGISVFVSSGDAGAAGCDAYFTTPPASQILSINYICASSHATCVGGTEFADFGSPSQYWSATNNSNLESALSYIPEGGWNEPMNSSGQPETGSSGGGVSAFIPTPSWQTGIGVLSANQGRYTPDIAFSASGHDGYFACFAAAGSSCVVQNGSYSFEFFSGTSASAPDMAGITALLNQKIGAPQGELNSNLYRLAAVPSNNVFHDITVASSAVSGCIVTTPSMCNNSTPSSTSQSGGLSGFLIGTGYDEVTGLGSIDVANLLASWAAAPSTTSLSSSLNPVLLGASVTFTATVTSSTSGTPTGTVTFLDNGASIGSAPLNSGAVATFSTSTLAVSTHPITAQYGGDSKFSSSSSTNIAQVVNAKPTTASLLSSLNPSIGGQSVTFTATIASTAGGTPTGAVTFLDGATPLGTGGLSGSGVATFTSLALSVGAHSITASYSGDASFAISTAPAVSETVSVAGFAPVPSAMVTAGNSVQINLTAFAAAGSNLTFALSCVGIPAKSTCAFSPSSVSPGAPPTGTSIQLTFGTSSSALPPGPSRPKPWLWIAMGILAAIATLLGMTHFPSALKRKNVPAFATCVAIVALATILVGCGGPTTTTPPYTGTAKGAATFTVTGTSGTATISTQVTVTIQ
jgi:subtilase family serine protease